MAKAKPVEDYLQDKVWLKEMKDKLNAHGKGILDELKEATNPKIMDYSDVVLERVRDRPLSYSSLKRFRKSPLEFVQYILEPRAPETPAMFFGKVFDCMLLEPYKFDEQYCLIPEKIHRGSNEGKAKATFYYEAIEGKSIVEEDVYRHSVEMVRAFYQNQSCRVFLDKIHKVQQWVRWKHPETGLELYGLQDFHTDPNENPFFVCDVKTAADASDNEMGRAAAKLDYALQGRIYTTGWKYKSFKFPKYITLAIEKTEPYNSNVLEYDKFFWEWAGEELQQTLVAFKYCLDNNLWHRSYDWLRDDIHVTGTMRKPAWVKGKFG